MKDQSHLHGTDTGLSWTLARPTQGEIPEPQLSADDIIELKHSLSLGTDVNAAPRVISHIVASMLEEAPQRSDARSSRDLARSVGFLAASWGMHLQSALGLPGSDWPDTMTPPATFADALKDVSAH